ncbi:hypothetical protein [Thermococcus sp.]|uniref:hypothetical protein n=1 Tax=Thermococcus sp. TaxID=35749 RepID=UPI00263812FA|nr:hypothetical protein [Thermococcus sp.]
MRPKTALLVVEATSLPLLVLTVLMLVTGYASVSTSAAKYSIFFSKTRAVAFHTSAFVRIALAGLLILHSYAGTRLLRARIKGKVGAFIEYTVLALLTYLLWVLVGGISQPQG